MESGPLSRKAIGRTTAMKECEVLRYFIGSSDASPKVTTSKVAFLQTQKSLLQFHCINIF